MRQEIPLCTYHTDSLGELENEVNRINLANCLETDMTSLIRRKYPEASDYESVQIQAAQFK